MLKKLVLACALALSPALAGAVTVGGDFVEGGALNMIDGSGLQGTANIDPVVGDTMASFVFEATENLTVRGLGTMLNVSFFNEVSVTSTPGSSVSLSFIPGLDVAGFGFDGISLLAGETLELDIAFVVNSDGANIDFSIFTEATPIPLPGSVWALMAGIMGLTLLRRRSAAA